MTDFFNLFFSAEFTNYFWIILMGILICIGCGLVGVYLVLRRMALIGDAISHSLLPGVALAFLITQSRHTLPMFIGGLIAGFVTNILIDWIHTRSRVKVDAAIGIVFSTLFALGIIIIALFADHVDLDVDCVLYGEIGFVPLAEYVKIGDYAIAPIPVIRMGGIVVLVMTTIGLLYKELLLTSFDPGYARSIGFSLNAIQYVLTVLLSLTIVSAFEAVGSILVIAMLVFPAATMMLLSDRLPTILWGVGGLAVLYSCLGLLLAFQLDASIAGAMGVVAGIIFLVAWVLNPKRGLLGKLLRRQKAPLEMTGE